jgi:hypothetical protein
VAKGEWQWMGGGGCLVALERGERGASNGGKIIDIG